jgi:hypothetical protein
MKITKEPYLKVRQRRFDSRQGVSSRLRLHPPGVINGLITRYRTSAILSETCFLGAMSNFSIVGRSWVFSWNNVFRHCWYQLHIPSTVHIVGITFRLPYRRVPFMKPAWLLWCRTFLGLGRLSGFESSYIIMLWKVNLLFSCFYKLLRWSVQTK